MGYGADFWKLTFVDCVDVKLSLFYSFHMKLKSIIEVTLLLSFYLYSYSSCPLYRSKLRCLGYSDLICNDSRGGERKTGNTEGSEFNNEK